MDAQVFVRGLSQLLFEFDGGFLQLLDQLLFLLESAFEFEIEGFILRCIFFELVVDADEFVNLFEGLLVTDFVVIAVY